MKKTMVEITSETKELLKQLCEKTGRTQKNEVHFLVKEALEKLEKK
jgi:predicted DNA-binding protein